MRPPIASLLLSVSLVLFPAFAMPSAADPQLDELSAADPQLDELSAADLQLDELSEALSRRLSEQVDDLLSELASAALEEQIEKLATRRATRVAKVPDDGGLMRCRALRDAKLRCVVVAMRSEAPASNDFATAQP